MPAPCPPQQSKPLWSSNSSPAGFGLSQDAWPCCCSPTGLISHPCRSAAPGVTGRSCPRVPLQPGSWLSRVLPRGDSLAHRQTHTASGSLRARSQGMAPVQRRLPWGCPARRHRARKRSTGAGEVSLLPVLPVPSPAWWLSPVGAGSQGRGAEPLILGVRICPKAVERGKLGGVAAAQGDGDRGDGWDMGLTCSQDGAWGRAAGGDGLSNALVHARDPAFAAWRGELGGGCVLSAPVLPPAHAGS